MTTLRVAALQMNSQDNREENLRVAEDLIDRAADQGASLVVLPELFNYLGPLEQVRAHAETIPGPTIERLAHKARRRRLYVHCGSIGEAVEGMPRVFNATVVLDPAGEIVARYRKIHLFDVEIPGRVSANESSVFAPGDETVTFDLDGITVGLAICYDLRFPELYRILALRGAQVIVMGAAFHLFTGKDHWEVLLRARAIENQAFLVAAAQVGTHPPGIACYGRSMVVDPWGLSLATAPDEVTTIVADLDLDRLATIRRELPSLANRRPEAY